MARRWNRSRGTWVAVATACGTVAYGAAIAEVPARAGPVPIDRPLRAHVYRTWTESDGLPHSRILALAQAADGMLWLGTEEGLVRFDGARFVPVAWPAIEKTYGTVAALAPRRAGGVWAAGPGLAWAAVAGGEALADRSVFGETPRQVLELADGSVHALGRDALLKLDAGRRMVPVALEAQLGEKALAMAPAAAGGVWVAGAETAARLDGHGRLHERRAVPAGRVRVLLEDAGGVLWVGGQRGLFRAARGGAFEPDAAVASVQLVGAEDVRALAVARRGGLWIGTAAGLFLRKGEGIDRFTHEEGLGDDRIRVLLEDREDSLWIGTDGGGLMRLAPPAAMTYTKRDGLPHDYPTALVAAGEALWVGTREGLALGRRGAFATVPSRSGRDPVRGLAARRAGGVWMASDAGIEALTEAGPVSDGGPPLQASAHAVHEGRDGTLWAARDDGAVLRRRPGGGWSEQRGPGPQVHALHQARDGALFVATRAGLVRQTDSGARTFTRREGLPDEHVQTVVEDDGGRVWAGTDDGLVRVDGGRLVAYSDPQGLTVGRVFAIVDDGRGHLWLSSPRGVHRVSLSDLDEVASGRRARVRVRSFGRGDGMKSRVGHGGYAPAAARTTDGQIWLTTDKGVVAFDPAAAGQRPSWPAPLIESVVVDGRTLSARAGGLTIAPRFDQLEIRFTVPVLRDAPGMRLETRLEGVDRNWRTVEADRVARYHDVPPGRRRFEVRVSDGGGTAEIRDPVAHVALEFQPRLHQTVWFRAALVLALVALVAGLHRLRTARLRANFALVLGERQRLGREIHDTLAQVLSGTWMHVEALRRPQVRATLPAPINQSIDAIAGLTSGGLAEARRLVGELSSEKGEGSNLVMGLTATVQRLTAGHGVAVDLDVRADEGKPLEVPPDIERHVLLIGHEAVANAIKHARAGRLQVELAFSNDGLTLVVRDDGRGFDGEGTAPPGHFGLANMRERTAACGGTLEIAGAPGAGTTVRLFVPVRAAAAAGERA